MAQTSAPAHTPITNEEIAKTFDEEIAPVDLSGHGPEDWVTLILFWGMCLCVFLQFFTRYVLNDSYAWTEEVAVYCLVAIVFLGSAMCVRMSRHIHVDFLYRYLPPKGGRLFATFVDIVRIVVFGYLSVLVWRYSDIIHDERMTTINFPKMPLFMAVFVAFVLMTLRSIQVAYRDLRNGYSILERPGAFDGSEEEAAQEAAKSAAKGA
ncbi:MAG: TRAP transporter permease DctQ [Rhizobiales bacterium PAR1]|nr:MAG: TRAP transporter permease DctQ [Rhizobiales bacterium PAR1]